METRRGRKNLRSNTRFGRKNLNTKTELKKSSKNEHMYISESLNDKIKEKIQDADSEEDKSQVYSALLTLLDSENKIDKRLENSENFSNVKQADFEPGLIAANNDENDNFDEEGKEEQDLFEQHFNQVEEHELNSMDAAVRQHNIRYRSVKLDTKKKDEELLYSVPIISGVSDSEQEVPFFSRERSFQSYFIKKRLRLTYDLTDDTKEPLTPLQQDLVDPMFQYKDILYEYDDYSLEFEYRDLYLLHVLNHVYKTRDRILKNNQKLLENPDLECLDQGFTRPKILIVLPSRDAAYSVINQIIGKSGVDQVYKSSKFKEQFYDDSSCSSSKQESFRHIFKGNTNDFFVIGVKFTRKAIKLYSNFYQSDIILCSPLGIQLILENTDQKKRQDDFLSSIEIMVVDQLHSIEFQNTSHVNTIFQHINKIPEQHHDADFSRIRMWYINDQAHFLRQTMLFTRYNSPFANSLFNSKCHNIAGRLKNHRIITSEKSALNQLGFKIRQIFQRYTLLGGKASDHPNYRFKFFINVIIPVITNSTGYEDGILLYITDYTDYLRIRNYLKDKTTILFGDINEYSDQSQLTSKRALFQHERVKVLLYTERLQHFRRYELKGVKSVIFYQPPSNPEFYQEVVGFVGKSAFLGNIDLNIATIRCIYSKLDSLALERIVGTKRAAVLTYGQNEVYEFR